MHENKAHTFVHILLYMYTCILCRSIHMYAYILDIIVFAELDGF